MPRELHMAISFGVSFLNQKWQLNITPTSKMEFMNMIEMCRYDIYQFFYYMYPELDKFEEHKFAQEERKKRSFL